VFLHNIFKFRETVSKVEEEEENEMKKEREEFAYGEVSKKLMPD
jgi:hypothetical protein